jgi:methyl-accepting chemotaxis protein
MKKLITSLLFGAFILSSSACALTDKTQEIGDDIVESYENVSEEAGEIYDDLKEKKESAEETIDDIKNAAEELGEAADAVKEITD